MSAATTLRTMPAVPAAPAVSQPITDAWPVKRVVATALFTDRSGRVLVVEPTYKPQWELPGGAVEDGESPWTAARREVSEELGLDWRPGRLLVMDYVAARAERGEGVAAVFDGGVLAASVRLRLPPAELRSHAFVSVDQLHDYLPPLLVRRAISAAMARRTGQTAYLENGRSVAS